MKPALTFLTLIALLLAPLSVSPMPPMGDVLAAQDVADISAWLLGLQGEKTSAAVPPKAAALPAAPRSESAAKVVSPTVWPKGDGFRFTESADRLVIAHSGQPVGEFVFADKTTLRPFFANLRTPGGIPVTRTWPPVAGVDPVDHADMHPGLWLGFGDIADTDFWRNKGRIVQERFSQPPALENGTLRFTTESAMLTADGKKLASLTSRFALMEKRGAWHLTWEAAFTPVIDGFHFGDQEEMGLGVRVATAITEKNGGVITSSSGQTTAKATWGQPAAWCDYSGVINGKHAGVTIVPDLANPHPSWWHNRDYGLFVANPFGRAAMKQGTESRIEVKKGETFRLKFTVILHAEKK